MNSLKESFREQALICRNELNSEEIKEKSEKIVNRFFKLDCFRNHKTIFCYLSIGSEVNTYELVERLLQLKIRVCLPVITPNTTEMSFYTIDNLNEDLEEGIFGLKQPNPRKTIKVNPEIADIIIVPGIAFDKSFNRIGYGKGYYDDFLKKARPDAKKVAFAYAVQINERIPANEWDVKMDAIVTENEVIGP